MPDQDVSTEKAPPVSTGVSIPSDARAHFGYAQFHVYDSDGHIWLVSLEDAETGLELCAFYAPDKVGYKAPIGKVIEFLKNQKAVAAKLTALEAYVAADNRKPVEGATP